MNAWKRLFAGFLLAALAQGWATTPARAQDVPGTVTELVRESQAAAAKGDHAEAERLARKAVSLDPAHPPAWRQQGLALLLSDKPADAITALRRAVELDKGDATAWRALGQASWKAERQHEAVRALGEYLRIKPEDAAVWKDLSVWLTRLGKAPEAIAALNRVVDLSAGDASAWRQLGVLQQRSGNAAEAIAAYEKAVALRADDFATRRDLGWLLWTGGRRDDGVARLAEAVEGGVEARERIVSQVVARLAEEGQGAAALEFLRRVSPKTKPSETGLELAKAGRLKAAEPILRSAWDSGEKTPDVGLYFAYARALNGRFGELAEMLAPLLDAEAAQTPERADLALEILRLGGTRPEIPAIMARLAPIVDRLGGNVARVTDILETSAEAHRVREAPAEALALYRRVLDRDPDRASWIWVALLAERLDGETPLEWLEEAELKANAPARKLGIRGFRTERLGRSKESLTVLRESVSLDPKQPQLRQILFRLLLKSGRTDEARNEVAWFAQQVESGDSTLRSYLAEMLTRMNDTKAALEQWKLLHSAYPDHPYYALETASALFLLGQPDEATDLLQAMLATTPDARLYELLAEIAMARGHTEAAVKWAAAGLAETPTQGLLRYHAENLELLGGGEADALKSAQSFLENDRGYVPLTLLAARMIAAVPPSDDAFEQYHRGLLARNPSFVPSLAAVRDAATSDGRLDDAVDAARRRAEAQPGNIDALRAYATSLAQTDRFVKALDVLRPLADTPVARGVPILVYTSVSVHPYPGRNSVEQITAHLARLAQTGTELVNTFAEAAVHDGERRAILLLVDPEPAVVEALDPVLRQHNARVLYVGNAAIPALTLSGIPYNETQIRILKEGHWRLVSGGPTDLQRVPVGPDKLRGSPLTHPVLVDGQSEDAAAFSARLDATLATASTALSGSQERVLLYPSGDYGQRSLDTDAANLATLRAAVARHFTHALYFDDSGFLVATKDADPLRIPARTVPPEWDADALAAYLGDGHPLVRARMELARVLYWHGQHEAAHAALAEAEAAGADPFEVAFNAGLNADRQGDVPTAVDRLRTASELDPASDRVREALARAEERRRPQAQVLLQGWDDNEDRSHLSLGIRGDAFATDRVRVGAFGDINRWETDGVDRIDGTRLGLRAQWYAAEQIWLSGGIWNLDLDELDSRWGGEAALRLPNPVLSGYLTLALSREEIETVEALRSDINAQLYALRTYTRLFDVFDLFADLSLNDRTDDNATTMAEGRLLYRIKEWPYLGVGWRFRFADSDLDPPEYWAPEELEQHQLHANLRGTWGRLNGTLSGDVGYAREVDTDWRFVWGARAEGEWTLTERLALFAQLGWFEGPEYERLYGQLGITGRF